jgi:hypothetical protein
MYSRTEIVRRPGNATGCDRRADTGKEASMITSPSKEQVRQWLNDRRVAQGALPDNDTIRRQLGWGLVKPGKR